MDNVLDDLLREALTIEARSRRGRGSINRLEAIKAICHSTYSNPDNWHEGCLVELMHRDSGSYLGLFQEMLHKRVNARKLVRLDSAVLDADKVNNIRIEYVEGDEWLGGPFVHIVDPPTEGELAAIRRAWQPHSLRFAWKHLQHKRAKAAADDVLDELIAGE